MVDRAPLRAGSSVVRRFPAHPSALHTIREFVSDQAVEAGLRTEDAIDLALAVSEAGTISVCETNSSMIEVSWQATGERVVIEVKDDGVYLPDRTPKRSDTMGIALIRALVDDFQFQEGTQVEPGNVARLVKHRRR
jgi:anti-sigma regulatory factor (Ser/Thr protein kinase)